MRSVSNPAALREELFGDRARGRVYLIPELDWLGEDARISLPQEYVNAFEKLPPLSLQFWPESVSDARDSGRTEKRIPGLSAPLWRWTTGGARTVSFTAMFTRDVEDDDDLRDPTMAEDNYDIDGAVAWLRTFQLATYTDDGEPLPPPAIILVMEGFNLGWDGDPEMLCFMSGCDVTYNAWFPNGKLRSADASLQFSELIQTTTRIVPPNRSELIKRSQLVTRLTVGKGEETRGQIQARLGRLTGTLVPAP